MIPHFDFACNKRKNQNPILFKKIHLCMCISSISTTFETLNFGVFFNNLEIQIIDFATHK